MTTPPKATPLPKIGPIVRPPMNVPPLVVPNPTGRPVPKNG